MAFQDSALRLMLREGGYVNNPSDKGGETKWGISKLSFPEVDIKSLTMDDAAKIYKAQYWDKLQLDRLSPDIADKVFDLAVNAGVHEAVLVLQRATRGCHASPLEEDGVLGNHTAMVVSGIKIDLLLAALRCEAAGFYRVLVAKDPTQAVFISDWLTRAYTV